jgi:hypothetical protein
MVQGLQIDTDHWRHLFLMFGCLYGLASATRIERAKRSRNPLSRPKFSNQGYAETRLPLPSS